MWKQQTPQPSQEMTGKAESGLASGRFMTRNHNPKRQRGAAGASLTLQVMTLDYKCSTIST